MKGKQKTAYETSGLSKDEFLAVWGRIDSDVIKKTSGASIGSIMKATLGARMPSESPRPLYHGACGSKKLPGYILHAGKKFAHTKNLFTSSVAALSVRSIVCAVRTKLVYAYSFIISKWINYRIRRM